MTSFRKAGTALLFVAPFAVSLCASGCSDDPPPIGRVYLTSTMLSGKDGAQACGVQQASWVSIGTPTASVEDGQTQGGARVTVSCTVSPTGDGFNVFAAAVLSGIGSITINGKLTSAGGDKSVRAIFQRGDTGKFEQSDCSVTFDSGMGIAAGRVWGNLDCPRIQDRGSSVTLGDGGSSPKTCAANAEFKFENCGQ